MSYPLNNFIYPPVVLSSDFYQNSSRNILYIESTFRTQRNYTMTSRIFSLFTQKKKPKKGTGDPHQSMIDFISEEPSMNDSFRSQQPNLETSFSGFNSSRTLTEASPGFEDFHIKKQPRANISSVFNTPKRVRSIYSHLSKIGISRCLWLKT